MHNKVYCFPTATGILKGYDQLLNLVLDNTVEHLRGEGIVVVMVTHDLLTCCRSR